MSSRLHRELGASVQNLVFPMDFDHHPYNNAMRYRATRWKCSKLNSSSTDKAPQTLQRCPPCRSTIVQLVRRSRDVAAVCNSDDVRRLWRDEASVERRVAEWYNCGRPLQIRYRESRRQRAAARRVTVIQKNWSDEALYRQRQLHWSDTGSAVCRRDWRWTFQLLSLRRHVDPCCLAAERVRALHHLHRTVSAACRFVRSSEGELTSPKGTVAWFCPMATLAVSALSPCRLPTLARRTRPCQRCRAETCSCRLWWCTDFVVRRRRRLSAAGVLWRWISRSSRTSNR